MGNSTAPNATGCSSTWPGASRAADEAAALRTLKRRMSALGEAAADSAFTRRLSGWRSPVARSRPDLAWPPGARPLAARLARRPGREIRPAWYVALGCSAVFLTSIGTAAFMAGSSAQPAPRVTPQVDVFMSQYDVTTGLVPGPAASARAAR